MAVINLDVDGVVCDFVGGLFSALREEGFNPKPMNDPSWKRWFFFHDMDDDMRMASFEIMSDHNFWRNLIPIFGSMHAVTSLYEAGHIIQWVTAPWEDCFGWRDARRDWLFQHFSFEGKVNVAEDLFIAKNKAMVSGDLFIDDKPENIRSWKGQNLGRAILYRSHFNRRFHDSMESMTWSDDSVRAILNFLCQ